MARSTRPARAHPDGHLGRVPHLAEQGTEDGRRGVRLKDLGRSASKQYGSIDKYVKAEVLPALVDRGLYERREGRVLWIFPTTRYELTQQGTEAQADLNRWLEVGRERFPAWSSDDPRRAMSYAGMAGASLLLMPMLYGDLSDLRERARSDSSGGEAAAYVPGRGRRHR